MRIGRGTLRPIMVAALGAIALLGCSNPESAEKSLTMAGEEQEVRGIVTDATLTACAPEEGRPGTCEGNLVVQPQGAEAGGGVRVEVRRDIALLKDGQKVFLPQLKGSQAVVRYRATEQGPNLATSVTATQ